MWTEDLSKREDFEEYTRPQVPTIVLPPEPAPKEMVDEVVEEVVQRPVLKKKSK